MFATEILGYRLSEAEMEEILKESWKVVAQAELRSLVHLLG